MTAGCVSLLMQQRHTEAFHMRRNVTVGNNCTERRLSVAAASHQLRFPVNRLPPARNMRATPAAAMVGALLLLTGCSSLTLDTAKLSTSEVKSTIAADKEALARDVEPLAGPLTMEGAVARAIKYNADRRYRAMEEAVAMGAFEVGQFDMLPKVREMRPDVPVIMITAYGDVETRRKAMERGAVGLLTKPIDFTVLREEIDARLERAA